MSKPIYKMSGNYLRRARLEDNMSQKELACVVWDVDEPTLAQIVQISRWETGYAPLPPKYASIYADMGLHLKEYIARLTYEKAHRLQKRYQEAVSDRQTA